MATHTLSWRYSTPAIVLHWLLAALIAFMAGLGWYMMTVEDEPGGPALFDLHKSIGLVVLLLVVLRLLWRTRHSPQPLPAAVPAWQARLSGIVQGLLYACMVLVPVTGLTGASYSRAGIAFFGAKLPAWVTPSRPVAHQLFEIHSLLVWVLVVLVALHALAGFKHLLVDRDEVFARMWPARRR